MFEPALSAPVPITISFSGLIPFEYVNEPINTESIDPPFVPPTLLYPAAYPIAVLFAPDVKPNAK